MNRKKARRKSNYISEIKQNLEYWLSRPPEERLEAVEALRRAYYGDLPRIKRVVRVVSLEES